MLVETPRRTNEAMARRLQRFLPLPAHARPSLLAALRSHAPRATCASRLIVTNVFAAGGAGLMCRISVAADAPSSPILVVPLSQLAFDRRHPISREITVYRRCADRKLP